MKIIEEQSILNHAELQSQVNDCLIFSTEKT